MTKKSTVYLNRLTVIPAQAGIQQWHDSCLVLALERMGVHLIRGDIPGEMFMPTLWQVELILVVGLGLIALMAALAIIARRTG